MHLNKMRLAFMSEEVATTFFPSMAMEWRSQAFLSKNKGTKARIKDAPSRGESDATSN